MIAPELVPLEPDVIDSQLPPDVTAAVQFIVTPPLLDTVNEVVPVSLTTFWTAGLTSSVAGKGAGPGPGPGPWVGVGVGVGVGVEVTVILTL